MITKILTFNSAAYSIRIVYSGGQIVVDPTPPLAYQSCALLLALHLLHTAGGGRCDSSIIDFAVTRLCPRQSTGQPLFICGDPTR